MTISRRKLIGAGAAGSAAAVLPWVPATAAGPGFDFLGSSGPRALAVPGRTPGLSYLNLSPYDVTPSGPITAGVAVGTTSSGGLLVSPRLVPGSRLKEVTLYVANTSADATDTLNVSCLVRSEDVEVPPDLRSEEVPVNLVAYQVVNFGYDVLITDQTLTIVVETEYSNGQAYAGGRVGYVPPSPFVAVAPTRVYSSRGGAKLGVHEERVVDLSAHVPAGATTAVCTVTLDATEGPGGFVSLYAGNAIYSGTSTVNWSAPGQAIANTAVVSLSPTRTMKVRGGDTGATHVLIDLVGYLM